jgi:hypothetical protein
MIVVSVTSVSPCAGASSLCAALASLASRLDEAPRVLCADASSGGPGASALFGAMPGGEACPQAPASDPFEGLCRSSCGVCVLRCSPEAFSKASSEFKSLPFDLVFCDSGCRGTRTEFDAEAASDLTLSVITAEGNCLERLDSEEECAGEHYVINRFDRRSKSMYDSRLFLAKSAIAPRLLRTVIPFDEAVLGSTLALKPYPLSSPISSASDAAAGVLAEVLSLCRSGGDRQ